MADAGTLTATPAYYVFRHVSQYVAPGAKRIDATGGDAVAFKNPDGSLVAVMFNSGAANNSYVVSIGGKKLAVRDARQRLGDGQVRALTRVARGAGAHRWTAVHFWTTRV